MLKGEIEGIKELLKSNLEDSNQINKIALLQISEKLDSMINEYQESSK